MEKQADQPMCASVPRSETEDAGVHSFLHSARTYRTIPVVEGAEVYNTGVLLASWNLHFREAVGQ